MLRKFFADAVNFLVGYSAGYGVAVIAVTQYPPDHPYIVSAGAFVVWIGCIVLQSFLGNKCHG